MLLVVQVEESLAVARAAPVVDRVDGVAMVHEVLDGGVVAQSALPTGAAMDPDDGGRGRRRTGHFRTVEDARHLQPVIAGKARDLAVHKHVCVDIGGERGGQADLLPGRDVGDVDIGRGAVAAEQVGELGFVRVEAHIADLAHGLVGVADELSGGAVAALELGRRVVVDDDLKGSRRR